MLHQELKHSEFSHSQLLICSLIYSIQPANLLGMPTSPPAALLLSSKPFLQLLTCRYQLIHIFSRKLSITTFLTLH